MDNYCIICRKFFITKNFLFPVPQVYSNVPLSKEHQELWLEAIGRKDKGKINKTFVCSKHFVYGKPAKSTERYHVDWLPTVNIRNKNAARRQKKNQKEDAILLQLIKTNSHKQYLDAYSETTTRLREKRLHQLIREEINRDKILDDMEAEQRREEIEKRKEKERRRALRLTRRAIQRLRRRPRAQSRCENAIYQSDAELIHTKIYDTH